MLNEILSALVAVATLQNLLIMIAGIWGGVIVGAIPGMTGTMAVTLALPFTFYMDPVPSILLLVALYKGSTYGGSVSAILIKTPATVVSAKSISMKNSGGPMCSASTASGAAKKISDRFEMKSPVTEE